MTEIDFALNQTNDTDIIELVGTVIWNKANKQKSFQNLSEPEKTFVFIDIFESEINHNGLYGFFYNTSGEFTHEVLQAFININAHKTVAVLVKALKPFSDLPVPKDIMLRRRMIKQLSKKDLIFWSDLELDLVDSKEDIVDLTINFIKINKTSFEY